MVACGVNASIPSHRPIYGQTMFIKFSISQTCLHHPLYIPTRYNDSTPQVMRYKLLLLLHHLLYSCMLLYKYEERMPK